jgi:hypothetical protein
LQRMSTPGERSEPQASEASPSRAKRGTLRRAKRGSSEIVKSIELSAAPRRFTSYFFCEADAAERSEAMKSSSFPPPRGAFTRFAILAILLQ